MKKKICNIVNFIRLEDHRMPHIEHFEPVIEQMKLIKKYNFPATWLLQFDALKAGPYADFFKKEMPETHELGLWLEINRMHCDAAGVEFRGRDGVNWDHHSQASLTIGYRNAEREKLADTAMALFHDTFGYYPKSVAAWYLDAYTIGYLEKKYQIRATANCRDQWGTDGYSIWGGFWAGAYYPSKVNANLPGESADTQINVPLFRMLGSCPVNQYDCALGENGQGVTTLEPTCCKDKEWMDILFRNMFHNLSTDYSYIQLGQENSFGWPRMKEGYEMQMANLAEYEKKDDVEVMTMGETGEWYLNTYKETVPLSTVALEDPWHAQRQTFWFNTRYYRASLLRDGDSLELQDLHCFSDRYAETYLKRRCHTHAMITDALPVTEGFLYQSPGVQTKMKIQLRENGIWKDLSAKDCKADTSVDGQLSIVCGPFQWKFTETAIEMIMKENIPWRIILPYHKDTFRLATREKIAYCHNGCPYDMGLYGIESIEEHQHVLILTPSPGSPVRMFPG